MASINSLIPDIQKLVTTKGWFTNALSASFADSVAQRIQSQFEIKERTPQLYLSKMGPRCPKALWCSIHRPWEAEALPPWAEIKFTFGHIIEALAITLAKAAGHTVEGEQDELWVDGVKGRRDCVIDGCLVDIKSASSRSFQKFKDKSIVESDSFGYLDQLDGYLVGSLADPLVKVKDKGYLLAIDKQLGHMVLYEHTLRKDHILHRIRDYRSIVVRDTPPGCECGEVLDGKSGNRKLDVRASYSSFKWYCKPTLRCFLYSDGPRYLTHVARLPDVPEITHSGKLKTREEPFDVRTT